MHTLEAVRRYALFASIALAVTVAARNTPAEPLLSREDLHRLDRENQFYRVLQPEETAAANLDRLRRLGATEAELRLFAPQLEALWNVDPPRQWGWLRPEQIEAVQAVDRVYIPRLRAARLRFATGIELDPAHRGESQLTVHARWRHTLFRVLDVDQLVEFRLMNSESAQKLGRHFATVPLANDERRTIYDWQREYEYIMSLEGRWLRPETLEIRLDHWLRIRDLIGDARFAAYLSSAEPKFARLRTTLGPEVDSGTALDVWWIREQFQISLLGPRDFAVSNSTLAARTEERLRQRLGEDGATRYLASHDARWISVYQPQHVSARK